VRLDSFQKEEEKDIKKEHPVPLKGLIRQSGGGKSECQVLRKSKTNGKGRGPVLKKWKTGKARMESAIVEKGGGKKTEGGSVLLELGQGGVGGDNPVRSRVEGAELQKKVFHPGCVHGEAKGKKEKENGFQESTSKRRGLL